MGEEPWRRKGEQRESGGQDIDGYCGQLSRTQTSVNIEALEKHSMFWNCSLKDRGLDHMPTAPHTSASDRA